MRHLRLTGLSFAAALVLGLTGGASAAPLIGSQAAFGEFGMADGPIIKVQTLGMERRHDRRMARHDRRMDRRDYRHHRRMDRHY
jgi:hypothetical protein